MKIVIGVTTWGGERQERSTFLSYWNNTEASPHEIYLVCADGTKMDDAVTEKRIAHCRQFSADFLSRTGQSARRMIIDYAKTKEADLCFFINHDILFFSPGWLGRLTYFFERNREVGLVSLKPINGRGFHDHLEQWGGAPIVIEEVEGPFAIKLETAKQLDNIEDIDFDLQLLALGYPSFCLPWPPVLNMSPLPACGVSIKINRLVMWLDKLGQERSAEL